MAMALFACLSIGCSNDNEQIGASDTSYTPVCFGVNTSQTRTVYGDQASDKSWPIYWTTGDAVKIFCYNAAPGPTSAAYALNEGIGENVGTLTTPANPIMWRDGGSVHDFYAVYPSAGVEVDQTGVATFPVNTNQVCTITGNAVDGVFTAAPDMAKNAYMVANTSTTYKESVSLDFRPVMTTLDIVVQGPKDDNVSTIALTGISVISTVNNSNELKEGKFKYDISNSAMVETGVSGTTTMTTFVGVKDARNTGAEQNFIDLKKGESVRFTVFLPPCAINSTYTARIRLHAQANNTEGGKAVEAYATLGKNATTEIAASTKRSIKLPAISSYAKSNAWMTPLDDNTYVSQLSIPGTHDAATKNVDITGIANIGKSQELTIQQQLEMGIRAFDLRPTIDYKYTSFTAGYWYVENIYHSILDTRVSMESALNTIADFLDENPGEFVIIVTRWESERVRVIPPYQAEESNYVSAMQTFLANHTKYQSHKAMFKPDLTVGEMRGKILIASRNNLSPNASYETAHTGWGHATPGYHNITGTGGTGQVYVQDIYSKDEAGAESDTEYIQKKTQAVKDAMVESAGYYTNGAKKNYWMINHCSGYTSLNNYCDNAANVNPNIFNYLTGADKPAGPTGMVMLDYVGSRSNAYMLTTYQTYGDLLPQAIIDNNYKFPMRRK